jgi:peptidyl-prolyl cis-trans isomerase C
MKFLARCPIVLRIVAVVVLTPTIVIGLAVLLALRVTSLPANAAFRVGDTVVTRPELVNRLDLLRALYGIQAPPDPAKRDAFRRQSAQAVALSMLLDRAARDEGIVVEGKDVQDAFDQLIKARFPNGRGEFVELLGAVGASEKDVTDEITRQQTTRRLYEKITAAHAAELEVSEPEARRYYEQNPARFVDPETRHLRNIVVATESEAAEVIAKARSGVDFGQLAKQFSLDESTRDIGGDLGFVGRDRLDPDYAVAAFAGPVGDLFGPVRANKGWNVGQVTELHPAGQLSFEQVSDQLRAELKNAKSLLIWRDWVAERIRAADIQYADEFRPAEPNEPIPGDSAGPAPVKPEVPR